MLCKIELILILTIHLLVYLSKHRLSAELKWICIAKRKIDVTFLKAHPSIFILSRCKNKNFGHKNQLQISYYNVQFHSIMHLKQ